MLPNKKYKEELYKQYIKEVSNYNSLHLYSFNVFLAYRNIWKFINRKLLTNEEINIMLQLDIYKSTRKEISKIRNKTVINS